MKSKKILSKLKNSESAVVGIVVTVLLIGLFLVIMVLLNTLYIPQWLETSEAGHMDDISQQFSQLKYALDLQSIIDDNTAITTSIKLGTSDIPFFNKGRTSDTLEIIKDAITIEFSPGGSYTSDAIIFSSGNSYFVNQIYMYEAGALILGQDDKYISYGNPTILVTEYLNFNNTGPELDGANITFFIPQVEGLIGKTNVGGQGSYKIYTTTKSSSVEILYKNVSSIIVTNNYPDIDVLSAWENIFESTLMDQWINYDIIQEDNKIIFLLQDSDDVYNFLVGTKYIYAQISLGLAD
jgi:hypothetical protein